MQWNSFINICQWCFSSDSSWLLSWTSIPLAVDLMAAYFNIASWCMTLLSWSQNLSSRRKPPSLSMRWITLSPVAPPSQSKRTRLLYPKELDWRMMLKKLKTTRGPPQTSTNMAFGNIWGAIFHKCKTIVKGCFASVWGFFGNNC